MLKVLFYTNTDNEMDNPYFRYGAIKNYLIPFAKALFKSGSFEIKFLLRDHIYDRLLSEGLLDRMNNDFVVRTEDLVKNSLLNCVSSSYLDTTSEQCKKYGELIHSTIGEGFKPNIIIAWETPTGILRKVYSDALVLDVMPGFMSRPPYPKMISIDPYGLYKDCIYKYDLKEKHSIDLGLLEKLQSVYQSFFDSLKAKDILCQQYNCQKLEDKSLIPLQISKYFGFYHNTEYENQMDFLESTLNKNTQEEMIATQYTGNFVSEVVINNDSLAYFNRSKKRVFYSEKLNELDSASQFLIPYVKKVFSISSTLGMQAILFDKELVSESRSHLQYFSQNQTLARNLLALVLQRGMFFYKKAVEDESYLANVLLDLYQRKEKNNTGAELLPSSSVLGTNYSNYLKYSNFDAARKSFMRVFPEIESETFNKSDIRVSIESPSVKVVSFDVFDTLLRRNVGQPKDVFYLMQLELENQLNIEPIVRTNFIELRQLAERNLRQSLDAQLKNRLTKFEELRIEQIYSEMQRVVAVDLPINELVQLEQKIELKCLKKRQEGYLAYKDAIRAGKRIIVVSDFSHDQNFVKSALIKNGYTQIDAYYISSEIGLKKHSGTLFNYVLNKEHIKPNQMLHIGDNPIGDLKRSREKGIRSIRVPSNYELVKTAFVNGKKNERQLRDSAYLRQLYCLFAERNFKREFSRGISKKFELVSTKAEIGYLYLGPIMNGFADWILKNAQKDGIKQLVFFARDCYLPYQAAEIINAKKNLNLSIVYLPISRKSSTGLEIFKPNDIFKIRIDDYQKGNTVTDLLQDRFQFPIDELTEDDSKSLSRKIEDIPQVELYSILLDVTTKYWKSLSAVYQSRRDLYKQYLTERGIDLTVKTIGVDVGYKGSIHKKLGSIFSSGLEPYFFMTYSNGYGHSCLKNSKVFYNQNMFPFDAQEVFITRNLLFETLINEATGTCKNIYKDSSNRINFVKDMALPQSHIDTVQAIHKGAVIYFNDCANDKCPIKMERSICSLLFSDLVNTPTPTEVFLLKDLIFDNGFAGAKNTYFVSTPEHPEKKAKNLWPEANKKAITVEHSEVVSHEKDKELISDATNECGAITALLRSRVDKYIHEHESYNKYKKFRTNPELYFSDSPSLIVRLFGKVLY